MDIVKQIIDQRITKILQDNPELFSDKKDEERKRSQAFLLLGVAAYLDIDIAEAIQYTTDGGQDGGFDAAYIEDTQDSQINVVLFQSKYSRKLEDLEKDCQKALDQINTKMYAKEFEDAYEEVLCYGIAFYKKRCLVKNKK